MNPEEQLAKLLKQNQNIVFGKSLGTDPNRNCTVQTGEASILARSGGQISAGDCVAMRADDGQWYAVSSRVTGTVQRSPLFRKRNQVVAEESDSSSLKSIINAFLVGEGDIKPLFIPDSFIGAYSLSNTGDGQGFYAIHRSPSIDLFRFSRIEDNQEVLFKELSNLIGEYDGSIVEMDRAKRSSILGVCKQFFSIRQIYINHDRKL
jgi:hypothetical protein